MTFISRVAEKRKVNIVQNAMNCTTVGMAVPFMNKIWDPLTKSRMFGSLRVVMIRYQWFNPAVTQRRVLSQWSARFVSLK